MEAHSGTVNYQINPDTFWWVTTHFRARGGTSKRHLWPWWGGRGGVEGGEKEKCFIVSLQKVQVGNGCYPPSNVSIITTLGNPLATPHTHPTSPRLQGNNTFMTKPASAKGRSLGGQRSASKGPEITSRRTYPPVPNRCACISFMYLFIYLSLLLIPFWMWCLGTSPWCIQPVARWESLCLLNSVRLAECTGTRAVMDDARLIRKRQQNQ